MSERMKGGKSVEGMDVSTCERTDGRTDGQINEHHPGDRRTTL